MLDVIRGGSHELAIAGRCQHGERDAALLFARDPINQAKIGEPVPHVGQAGEGTARLRGQVTRAESTLRHQPNWYGHYQEVRGAFSPIWSRQFGRLTKGSQRPLGIGSTWLRCS